MQALSAGLEQALQGYFVLQRSIQNTALQEWAAWQT
jgi:hypothetical protein